MKLSLAKIIEIVATNLVANPPNSDILQRRPLMPNMEKAQGLCVLTFTKVTGLELILKLPILKKLVHNVKKLYFEITLFSKLFFSF